MNAYMKKLYVFLGTIDDKTATNLDENIVELFCSPNDSLTIEYRRGLLMGMCSAFTVYLNDRGGDFNAISLYHAYINYFAD